MPRRRCFLGWAGGAALLPGWLPGLSSAQPSAGQRMALVIGNGGYPDALLANAGNDARLVGATLRDMGFQVNLLQDATNAEMLAAAKRWLADAAAASVRMVYFAGHGAQYRGRNYLIPVDARLRSEDDLPGSAFNANDFIDRLSRYDSGVNVVVLDACRSIPSAQAVPGTRMRGPMQGLPATGWAASAAPRGTVVAYSTAPGAVAADNPQQRNSVYTRHFVAHLKTPGLPIEKVFKKTRAAVLQESGGAQVPWESSSLVNDFCFSVTATAVCGSS